MVQDRQKTDMKNIGKLIICCMATVVFINAKAFEMSEDKVQVGEFVVKPGGQVLSEKRDWEEANFSCNFTYSSQGGTQEQWLMGMAANNEGTQFSCSVERPEGVSYLMFQTFRLQLYGARVVKAEVHGADHSVLKDEEFIVDDDAVYQNDGKFGSTLGRVVVYGIKPKQEL